MYQTEVRGAPPETRRIEAIATELDGHGKVIDIWVGPRQFRLFGCVLCLIGPLAALCIPSNMTTEDPLYI